MSESEDYVARLFALTEEQKKRLIPIWIERIAFVFANLWGGPLGFRYQNDLAEASELLNQVSAKKMSKHTAMLEELEDKVETASFAAMAESKGREAMLTASIIADAVQLSLKVFLDGSSTPDEALALALAAMVGLEGGEGNDPLLVAALNHDIDYVSGKSVGFFRPLWPDGKPAKWPGTSHSWVSHGLGMLDITGGAKQMFPFLKFLK